MSAGLETSRKLYMRSKISGVIGNALLGKWGCWRAKPLYNNLTENQSSNGNLTSNNKCKVFTPLI